MKDCVHLFVVYTVLQILFSVLYWLLAKRIGATVLIGALLYAAAMASLYLSYKRERHRKQKQDLLNGFLQPPATSP